MKRLIPATAVALSLMVLASCAGGTVGVSASYPDADYWDGPVFDYGLDYYGPPVYYGGWGPGYWVGPPSWGGYPYGWDGHPYGWDGHPHGGDEHPHGPWGDGHSPGFRPAPPGRPMPSIPSAPRGGGMRGGPRSGPGR